VAKQLQIPCRVDDRDFLSVETNQDPKIDASLLDLTLECDGELVGVYINREDALHLSNWLFAWAHGGNRT